MREVAGAGELVEQHRRRNAAHAVARLIDGGETDVVERGERGVVVTHHRHDARDGQAGVVERVDDAHRREVVGGEEGRRQVAIAQLSPAGAVAGFLGEVAADHSHVLAEADGPHCGYVPGAARCRAGAAASIDMCDAAMPERVQVLYRESRALGVVGADRADHGVGQGPTRRDERDLPGDFLQAMEGETATGNEDAVDTGREEGVHAPRLHRRRTSTVGKDHLIAVTFGDSVDTVGHLREPRVVQVVEQQPDRHRPMCCQVAGREVAAVPENRGSFVHRGPCLRAGPWRVAHHQRHERARHARRGGDILHRRLLDTTAGGARHAHRTSR